MDRNALPIATRRHFHARVQVDVGAEEQVEIPVAIVVDKGTASAPLRCGQRQACFASDVGERAVAVVAEKHIVVVIGEEKIVQPVVVEVADGDARDPTGTRQTGFRSDILERSVAIVLVQPVAGSRGWSSAEARASQHQNVEPAIVIVIEESDAATDSLKNVALRVDRPINSWRT